MANEHQTVSRTVSGGELFDRKPRSAIGVTGFEPAASWSRTNNRPFSKSGPDSRVTSNSSGFEESESLFACTSRTPIIPPDAPNKPANGIADTVNGPCVTCERCQQDYRVTRLRHRGRHLCVSCRGKLGRDKSQRTFTCPPADAAKKIRANGLINKRLKLGKIKKPALCMKCKDRPAKDSHHLDYDLPNEIVWLCRSCHGRAHHDPKYLRGVPVIDTGAVDMAYSTRKDSALAPAGGAA